MMKKAEFTQQRLLFVIEALRQLLTDENFSNLLRAEGLNTLAEVRGKESRVYARSRDGSRGNANAWASFQQSII